MIVQIEETAATDSIVASYAAQDARRFLGCAEKLLLGCLVVRVGSRRVVGDVDHPEDLGDRFAYGHLDPLAQGDRRHPAARASSAQAEVGGVVLDGHQVGAAAVRGNARVDLLFEDLEDPLGDVAAEIGWWSRHGRAGGGRCGGRFGFWMTIPPVRRGDVEDGPRILPTLSPGPRAPDRRRRRTSPRDRRRPAAWK